MISVKIANYALVDILRSLESNGVSSCSITKEDGTLRVILTRADLHPYLKSQDTETFSK